MIALRSEVAHSVKKNQKEVKQAYDLIDNAHNKTLRDRSDL